LYFVTICTQDKEYFFGEIKNGEMNLNDIGKIVQEELLQTPIIRSNIFLDTWIVMPNHLHIIIEIINPVETPRWGVSESNGVSESSHINTPHINTPHINTPHINTPQDNTPQDNTPQDKTPQDKTPQDKTPQDKTPQRGVSTAGKCGGYNPNWKPNSLGSIINQFKSACTKRIWKSVPIGFHWQPRFFDHIIRNDETLNKIREYINKNPARWERDRNGLENLWM